MHERHQIYRRRFELGEPPPWTSDPTLQSRRFTNVYRSLDPGTIYIMAYLEENPPVDDVDLFWKISVYRMLNRIETYERHGIPERDTASIDSWFAGIRADQDAGISVATGSHCTHVRNIRPWLEDLTDDGRVRPIIEMAKQADTVEGVRKSIGVMRGLGSFMSLQVACDYLWSPYSHLPTTSRVPLAIGSRLSLDLMLTGVFDVRAPKQHSELLYDSLHDAARFMPLGDRQFTYTDLEHSLCEWGKYRRYEAGKRLSNFLPFKSGGTNDV